MCSIRGCKNYDKTSGNFKLYEVPDIEGDLSNLNKFLTDKRRKKWMEALENCGLNTDNVDSFKVCSSHFVNKKPAVISFTDDVDWVPTRFLTPTKRKMENTSRQRQIKDSSSDIEKVDEIVPALSRSRRKRTSTKDSKQNADFLFVDISEITKEDPILSPRAMKNDEVFQINRNPLVISEKKNLKSIGVQTKDSKNQANLGEIIEFIREQVLNYNLNASGTNYMLRKCDLIFEKQTCKSDLKVTNKQENVTIEMNKLASPNAFLLEHVEKCLEFHKSLKNECETPKNYFRTKNGKKESVIKKLKPDTENYRKMSEMSNFNLFNSADVIEIDDDDDVNNVPQICESQNFPPKKRKSITIQDILGTNKIPRVELERLPEDVVGENLKNKSKLASPIKQAINQLENVVFPVDNPDDVKQSKILLVPHRSKLNPKNSQNKSLNQKLTGYLLVSTDNPANMVFLPKNNDIIPDTSQRISKIEIPKKVNETISKEISGMIPNVLPKLVPSVSEKVSHIISPLKEPMKIVKNPEIQDKSETKPVIKVMENIITKTRYQDREESNGIQDVPVENLAETTNESMKNNGVEKDVNLGKIPKDGNESKIFLIGKEKDIFTIPADSRMRCCYCLKVCQGKEEFFNHYVEIGCRGGNSRGFHQAQPQIDKKNRGKYPDCNVCGRIFMEIEFLSFHVRTHEEYVEWTVECEECPKKFPNYKLLNEHVDEWHPNGRQEQKEETKKVFCRSCSKMIPAIEYRANHLKECEEKIKEERKAQLLEAKKAPVTESNKELVPLVVVELLNQQQAKHETLEVNFSDDEDLNGPIMRISKVEKKTFENILENGTNDVIIEEVDSD